MLFMLLNSIRIAQWSSLPFTKIIEYEEYKLHITIYLNNYLQFYQDSIYIQAALASLLFAIASTIIVIPFGFLIAWQLVQMSYKMPRMSGLLHTLLMIPMFLPFIIKIYAWLYIHHNFFTYTCNNYQITQCVILLITSVYLNLSMVVAIIKDDLDNIEPDIANAAADLGAKPFQVLTNIVLPLSIHSIATSSILVFSFAIGDYIIPELLSNGLFHTIGSLAHKECFVFHNLPMSAVISIFMIFWSLLPIIILKLMRSKIV